MQETAIEIQKHALDAIRSLSQALSACENQCSPEEYQRIKRGVGLSMGRIETELLGIIYDCDDSKVPVPVPVRRHLDQPGLDELRMQEEAARQMEEFWKKILIGDLIIGGVLLAPQVTPVIIKVAPRITPKSGPAPAPVPRPVPVP